MEKAKDGNVLMCPFCNPPHQVSPFVPSPCGSLVVVKVVQEVYHAKYDRTLVCAKCGKGGGDMVKWNEAYIHTGNCMPGVVTFANPPKISKNVEKIAKWVHGLKDGKPKKIIESVFGRAMTIDEVKPDGERTGVVLGHFFYKEAKKGN